MLSYDLKEFEALALLVAGASPPGETPKVSPDGRRQVRFAFNLDWANDQDRTIGQYLNWFKERRQMTQLVRDAVRLYVDLMNGRVDVLAEMFPGIIAKIQAANTDRVGQALQSLAQSQALMAEAMMRQPAALDAPRPAPGPKPLFQSVAPALAEDDDLPALEIKKAETSGKVSASNFLDSAFNLVR